MNLLVVATLLLAGPNAGAEPPPTVGFGSLGGNLSDFDWLRGRYTESGPERVRWQALLNRAQTQARLQINKAQQQVREHNARLSYRGDGCFGDEACEWVLRTDQVAAKFEHWAQFSAAWQEALPVLRGYLAAVREGEAQIRRMAGSGTLDTELKVRAARDQMLRTSLSNENFDLTPSGLAVFQLAMSQHISRTDRANTDWLRRTIELDGWPLPPEVTLEGTRAAWLLVLHARHDPSFRLGVLARLKRLADAGRIGHADLAVKVDHILSEITGLQRFGTKGDCVDGSFIPAESESPEAVPRLRREMGLPTLEEQASIMRRACSG